MNCQIERSPSHRPSPPGEGARWVGHESFESSSPRIYLLESPGECSDPRNAVISVQALQSALSAPPLRGERAGVRADQALTFPVTTNDHRPRIFRQRMRRARLQFTKDGIANHLWRASQPRVPKPEFLDAEAREELGPLLVVLTLLRKAVLRSVQFNRKPRLFAEKIQHVNPDGMLSPKLVSAEPAGAQPAPENSFGPSRVPTKRSGFVGHRTSVERCVENRVTPALTPTLSPRRGGALSNPGIIRALNSAFSPFGNTRRIFGCTKRGKQRSGFRKRSTRVPSPGAAGEASAEERIHPGQGEGRPILTDLHPI
jgi:hypothetical protein